MTCEIIANYKCHCGEGPCWHPTEKCVYWNDNETARFFRYDPATGQHKVVYDEGTVAACTVQQDGTLLLFMDRGTVALFRDGRVEPIIEDIPDERETRFNDVIADPEGRVFAGTMPTKDRPGRLYRIDRDGSYTLLLEGISCANGMGFTADLKTMYFTDTMIYTIWVFDYDRRTGAISNQREFVKLPESDGFPDGMTMDSEGCIWSALWDGSAVVRFAPQGTEIGRIELPTKKITCPVFGGDDLSHMYVTTAGGQDTNENGEHAGALFRITPGVTGVREFYSRISV